MNTTLRSNAGAFVIILTHFWLKGILEETYEKYVLFAGPVVFLFFKICQHKYSNVVCDSKNSEP